MSSTFLEYEIALLLAKYGKNAVLHALAMKMELSPDALESMLNEIPSRKVRPHSKKSVASIELIEDIIRSHPEKSQHLRILHGRFQNRTFLPELRDVKRFFEQHSEDLGAIKARAESLPRLIKLLANLDPPELDELSQTEPQSVYSSLGVISDEILRPRK